MTTSLFVIANVKQLRTDGSFRILLPFFPNILGWWRPKFSFHNWVEFGTILEGLRNFWVGGRVLNPLKPPRYATEKNNVEIFVRSRTQILVRNLLP